MIGYARIYALAILLSVVSYGSFRAVQAQVSGKLRDELVQSYPVLDGLKILCVKRHWPGNKKNAQGRIPLKLLGFPTNHESQSSLARDIYKNEIGVIDAKTGEYTTLYKPLGRRFVGHVNLHWNAEKLLFTQSDEINWKIFEINIDGTDLRQVSQAPDDVDCFDPCYLPDGRIMFNSNAPYQCVPCWHGVEQKYVANLYRMNADGSGMRRLCFDQDHDFHPFVRHNGQIIYNRWDYTGINRLFLRPLMTMNPDGTSQRAAYGSNSWFPMGSTIPRNFQGRPDNSSVSSQDITAVIVRQRSPSLI